MGGAHKCALRDTPVHAFGCSVQFENGEEGSGGSDRICVPCHIERQTAQTQLHQTVPGEIKIGHNLLPNKFNESMAVLSAGICMYGNVYYYRAVFVFHIVYITCLNRASWKLTKQTL